MNNLGKDLLLFWRARFKIQTSRRLKESSSLDSEDREEHSLIETDEENSDVDADCFYCSGLYTRDTRRKVDQMHTKLQWCNEECSSTDKWKTFLSFYFTSE